MLKSYLIKLSQECVSTKRTPMDIFNYSEFIESVHFTMQRLKESYKTDLIEVVIDIFFRCFGIKGVNPESTHNYDLSIGQFAKIALLLLAYFETQNNKHQIQFSLIFELQVDGKISSKTNYEWIGITWLLNQIYLILFERQYVFNQFSYTYHRIVFHKILGLAQNGYALYNLQRNENIKIIFEELWKKNYGILQFYTILFLINLFLDFISLIKIFIVQCFFEQQHKILADYHSKGGLRLFLVGFVVGSLFPIGVYVLHYFSEIKDKKQNSNYVYTFYANSISLGIQFVILFFYIRKSRKEEQANSSKKFLCFTYGLSFGIMNIYNSAFITTLLIGHFFCKIVLCFWCRRSKSSYCDITFLYCCTPNLANHRYELTEANANLGS